MTTPHFTLTPRSDKYKKLFSLYVAAGYPKRDSAIDIIETLDAGDEVDFIELGIPFSDPVADGPTIQKVNKQALENGISLERIFAQIKSVRQNGVTLPVFLMGHLNPLIQYGAEKFCDRCRELGVAGAVIPDLPPNIYARSYKHIFDKYDAKPVFLVTPHTPEERLREIDAISERFVYAVSSSAVTGGNLSVTQAAQAYYANVKRYCARNQIIGGFGVSSKESFDAITENLDGAVIASEYLRRLEKGGDPSAVTADFVKEIRGA